MNIDPFCIILRDIFVSAGFLCVFGLSASCAIYLILELNEPFNGLMRISDIPLRNALAPL